MFENHFPFPLQIHYCICLEYKVADKVFDTWLYEFTKGNMFYVYVVEL